MSAHKHRFLLVRSEPTDPFFHPSGCLSYTFICADGACRHAVEIDGDSLHLWQKPTLRFSWGPQASVLWGHEYNGGQDDEVAA